ncbi:hypothetical protein ACFPRL_18455 [Pseudoclavibacter helvolus]
MKDRLALRQTSMGFADRWWVTRHHELEEPIKRRAGARPKPACCGPRRSNRRPSCRPPRGTASAVARR